LETVADAVAQALAARGVERVFGFPGGGGNLALIDALERTGIAFVLTRGEVAAAIMAAATAELTGVPGAVLVGNGPGLTSVVNGVAHAQLDRVPLLVISDRFTEDEERLTGHQILDQRALLAPVVKWGATLARETAAETVADALAAAEAVPCGAVHIDIPRDVASAPVAGGMFTRNRSAVSFGDPDAVARGIAAARRPLLAVGLEARGIDVLPLAERLGAAVLTTYKAKGALPEDHPRWAGILTGGEIERPVLERSDAVLALGLDPVELLSRPWAATAPVYALRTCASGLEYLRPRAYSVGPLDTEALRGSAGGWPEAGIAAEREAMLARLRVGDTWRLICALRDELPPGTVASVDAGAHMFPATVFWRADGPRRFLISNGLATMGFAVPAAIAAALADPAGVSVAITGDGGFAYHGFELETAARLGARVIVVVINDASLSLIRIKGGSTLNFGTVDFARVGEGLGAAGAVVSDEPGLRAAVREALARPGSTVLDVRTDGREYGDTLRAIRG
jgi:acetolactate synthase-1/2/3 large subunit